MAHAVVAEYLALPLGPIKPAAGPMPRHELNAFRGVKRLLLGPG